MSSQRREAVMQIRVRRQAERDAKLEDYTHRLNETMREKNINTPAKQAAFLATVGIESAGMTQMEELPSRHASSRSLYKGRGIIQLTHEDNYRRASGELRLGEAPDYNLLVRQPELAATPEYAFRTAGWFWSAREHPFGIPNNVVGEQPRADLRDFREASSLVNSGRPDGPVNGWADRLVYYERALNALEIDVDQQTLDNIHAGQQGPRNLPPEQSYIDWRNEQRARRRANRND